MKNYHCVCVSVSVSVCVLQLSPFLSFFLCLFHNLHPFLSTTPSHSSHTRPAPLLSLSLLLFLLVCSLAGRFVLFNMHSPFLLLYYCPAGDGGLFFGQTMGGVVTESTVVMSHLPPHAISLSCPPHSLFLTRCLLFNSTLILLQERKT